jgi:hypothetical protein
VSLPSVSLVYKRKRPSVWSLSHENGEIYAALTYNPFKHVYKYVAVFTGEASLVLGLLAFFDELPKEAKPVDDAKENDTSYATLIEIVNSVAIGSGFYPDTALPMILWRWAADE